jgi:exosortase A
MTFDATSATPEAAGAAGSGGLTASPWRRPAIALCGVLALLAAYWPTVVEMARIWETSDTYAHGWLIAPISLWIIWTLRVRLAAAPQRLTWWALLPMLGAGAWWLLSHLVDIQVFQQLALVTMLLSLVLLLLGPAWCRVAMFPLGFLYLAVPMGDGLVPLMIDRTADFVVAALRVTGIPVYRDGTFFVIPSGSWSVVSGCSGMRYLMATVTVGTLFAWFNYRSLWRQCAFVVVSVAVAVFANWLRALGIVMIAHFSDMKLALGVDHYIYGWAFFGIIIFLLMAIGGLWSDRGPEPAFVPPADAGTPVPRQALPAALLLAALALVIWPLLARAIASHAPAAVPARPALEAAFDAAPLTPPDLAWQPHYAGQSAVEAGAVDLDGRLVGWHLAWYGAQTQGAELINAANELVHEKNEPWRPKSRRTRESGVDAVPEVIESELRARAGDRSLLVWQWYWAAGHAATNPLWVKVHGAVSQLRGAGNPGASVLIYRVLEDDGELDQARKDLAAVLRTAAPDLHRAFEERAAAR